MPKLYHTFGTDVLREDGTINRERLGQIIFNDPAQRRKLNSIVHPAVSRAMARDVLKCWFKGKRICVLDVPLLIEVGIANWVGKVVVVYCPRDMQLDRLMKRDNADVEASLSRLASQMSIDEKVAYADDVLDNSGNKDVLERNVELFVAKLRRETGWTYVLLWIFPPLGLLMALKSLLVRRWTRQRRGQPSSER